MIKNCIKCKETKDISFFPKNQSISSFRRDICKFCHNKYKKEKRLENPQKARDAALRYHYKNQKLCNEKSRLYNTKNKTILNEKSRLYYYQNQQKYKDKAKLNRTQNPGQYSKYEKSRKKIDPGFKLIKNLRSRIRSVLSRKTKSGSTIKSLGCSVEQLVIYIESKFQIGMTWDNYGVHGWHLDHIRPLSSFDLTDPNDFMLAAHYTNLQPLWAEDNLKKSNKLS